VDPAVLASGTLATRVDPAVLASGTLATRVDPAGYTGKVRFHSASTGWLRPII
jgi:hypothetical protein